MSTLSASVGWQGRNLAPDVVTVQDLLRAKGYDPGALRGVCGPETIDAIRRFQASFLPVPDGRIDPGHASWRKLSGVAAAAPGAAAQWSGDSSQWPLEKKLQSLTPALRPKVRNLLAALGQRGYQPKVFYGWRSVQVQERLFRDGNSKVKFSFHNVQHPDGTPDAYAADIIDSRYGWSALAAQSGFWRALGEEAKKQGLFWGGDWSSFRDWAHVQLVANSQLARVKRESGL